MKQRLVSLDGLRGLAIILVIFTHLPLSIWYSLLPQPLHFGLDILLGSGGIGVFIFFLLSGFFMGALYQAPRFLPFISRRYRRLFPPFLVMVVSFSLVSIFGDPGPWVSLLVLSGCILIGGFLWRRGNRVLVPGWLLLQLGVALLYMFVLLRVPAAVFLQLWHPQLRNLIIGVVNATLTLPFGQYIGQLDGVYWALTAEVFFYLTYPVVVIPLLRQVQHLKSRRGKIMLYLALFPFFMGLFFISQRILGFEIIKIHYMLYFVTGVIIGRHTDFFSKIIAKNQKIILHPLWLAFLFISIFGLLELQRFVPEMYHPWYQLSWVFPLSLLLMTLLHGNSTTAHFFEGKFLVFFGRYSYALFLVHTFIIHVTQKFITANTSTSALVMTAVTFALSLFFASILYQWVEKLYFSHTVKNEQPISAALGKPNWTTRCVVHIPITVTLTLVIFMLLYLAYKPPLSLFTTANRFTIAKKPLEVITDEPLQKTFTAQENNLGMIQSHIRRQPIVGAAPTEFVESQLRIRLRNEKGQEIAISSYEVYQMIDSVYHPFGFPVQTDSKNKRYTIEYQLSRTSPTELVHLINTEGDIITVYFPDKKSLFKNPMLGVAWLVRKFMEPLNNQLFWIHLLYCLPFLIGITAFTGRL